MHVDACAGQQVLENALAVACVADTLCGVSSCFAPPARGGWCVPSLILKWTNGAEHGRSDRSFSVRAAPT